jgi:hypothetical protein
MLKLVDMEQSAGITDIGAWGKSPGVGWEEVVCGVGGRGGGCGGGRGIKIRDRI